MIGIYKIENMINHKIYIGQSENIEKRWKQHKGREDNIHLKNAMEKYGLNNFSFEVLIKFIDGPFNKKYLNKFEEYFGKKYDAINRNKGYNIREYGTHGKMSNETLQVIKEKCSGIGNGFYGKKHSKESKIKMSLKQIGENNPRYGKVGLKGAKNPFFGKKGKDNPHSKSVICIETGIKFDSIRLASRFINKASTSITKCCKGKANTCGGFHWEYA